ncbi:MAG: hypothetical protein ACK58T_15125, partial [Phycisphaerae bacterium]
AAVSESIEEKLAAGRHRRRMSSEARASNASAARFCHPEIIVSGFMISLLPIYLNCTNAASLLETGILCHSRLCATGSASAVGSDTLAEPVAHIN